MSKGFVIWFTGLSGTGKSTLAGQVAQELGARGRHVEILDGDELRTHLSRGLGFSREDRDTNIRRIGYVARLVARSGAIAIAAAISPYRGVREEVRAQAPAFFEIYVRASLDELVRRDVKGLYQKALVGEIANFTGVSDPYEPPLNPELVVDSERETVVESTARILAELQRRGFVAGQPVVRLVEGEALAEARAEAAGLPRLEISPREAADVYMLGSGALSPLEGFAASDDYAAILESGRLASGSVFTIPVTLRVDRPVRRDRIALCHAGQPIGLLEVTGEFRAPHATEAMAIYGTRDPGHPGVAALLNTAETSIAGRVTALGRPATPFPDHDLTPAEVRAEKAQRGWHTMVGFQTRNPVHRAHEYLQKVALELVDGLLLHPLVGETKNDDLPANVRMRCYQVLIERYYPKARALLATNPAWMRYAGPREAVFHAIVRRNYGCTHFIVGRDHAGIGGYYPTYAAHRIFDHYKPWELGIKILRFENAFYCRVCGGMASSRTCPHGDAARVALSGTRVRQILIEGAELPVEFTRPEVAAVLRQAFRHERFPR